MSKKISRILLTLIFLSACVAHGADVWGFREIKMFNNSIPGLLQILHYQADTHGGEVEVEVSGKALNECPGGDEKLRFTWTFEGDITTATQGSVFSYTAHAEKGATGNPCPPGFAADRSMMDIIGSSGAGSPF